MGSASKGLKYTRPEWRGRSRLFVPKTRTAVRKDMAAVAASLFNNYFATMKRGIIGTYHHVSQQHLKRYLAEFDFRHNERAALGVDDASRAAKALSGIVGKRLTYRVSPGVGGR